MPHLAIIPARSGSKGLPGKNIRLLDGLPLLAWSIFTARESGIFDRIILSTDSEEYARIGQHYGADVPWLRKPDFAADDTSSTGVVLDLLSELDDTGEHYDHFTLLQPTSPLRIPADIRAAGEMLESKNADAIVSVCPCDHPPQWANTLPADLNMAHFLTPFSGLPRQALPLHYRVNGAVYMAVTRAFREYKSFFTPKTFALVMPAERSVDIDQETDFLLAELLMHKKQA